MDVSEAAEGESPAMTRPKRSRTGCLTCRTRRRKCDEAKPICQNCTSKGFECRYASAFQILGKNNYTPEVESNRAETGSAKTVESANTLSLSSPPVLGNSGVNQNRDRTDGQPRPADLQIVASHTPSPNSYAFALHGLLALGARAGGDDDLLFSPVENVESQTAASTIDSVLSGHAPLVLSGHEGQRIGAIQERASWQSTSPNPTQNPIEKVFESTTKTTTTTTESAHAPLNVNDDTRGWTSTPETRSRDLTLDLLKYYRYHIAPWLDICDSNQCFGVEILGLSAESTPIRYGILALADGALDKSKSTQLQDIADSSKDSISQQDVVQGALLDVFQILRDVSNDLPKFWEQEEAHGRGGLVLETVLLQLPNGSALASSIYWLLVRLVLSCALIASGPVRIPLPFIAENLFRSANNDNIARCAQDAISLCVDAVMFSQGDEDRWLQQRYGLNRVEVWKTLLQGFAHWYKHRPQEFQPIIELYPKDGVQSDNDFPMVVFTGGAAILANQLYHTGMLLLLQNKPRFADRPSSSSSAIQHAAIVYTFETIQRLTGWNVSQYAEELRREWQLADGW
ncbi:hypothetical protein IQ07DRAFT_519048 [Pyrenochaeta sp. DS3sAY3a]|nr:hypothetical protein IQ07DRAFT_519048 [Pyrenochaeta sp. DS3sAY3a]